LDIRSNILRILSAVFHNFII